MHQQFRFSSGGSLRSCFPEDRCHKGKGSYRAGLLCRTWGKWARSGEKYLEIGKRWHFQPFGEFRCATLPQYLEYLSDFRLSLKEHASLSKLIEDAANRPNIHGEIIPNSPKKKLRRPVPQSFNFLWHGLHARADDPAESEISNLDDSLVANQDVLRFEVPMENLLWVHVVNPLQNLMHNALNTLLATFTELWSNFRTTLNFLARSSSTNSKMSWTLGSGVS